ncbi:MAG: alkaline phosphatase PhoX, partial [Microthrixaceae bacterium]
MDRRGFLVGGLGSGLAVAPGLWPTIRHQAAVPGAGPYGALTEREPDANGILLPEGFTSRVLATSDSVVSGTDHVWHVFPDGGATYPTDDGWIYVSNSEAREPGAGGVSAILFDGDAQILDAYGILDGTSVNCAGGPTPWGTWLSCEEFDWHDNADAASSFGLAGMVYETDPTGTEEATALPAMGLFQHEAAAVDPVGERIYLTEDQPDGRLYRYSPTAYPDL